VATLDDQNQPLFFLVANSPMELHMLMIANNRRFSKRFHYLNPVFANKKWYVWFEIRESERLIEERNSGQN